MSQEVPMQVPIEITFRDVPKTGAVEALVREKAAKLEQVAITWYVIGLP